MEVVGDVSKDADARTLIEKTIAAFGRLDVLVNNAGVAGRGLITDDKVVDELDRIYNVNVRALVMVTHLAAPHLIAAKGNVINVSSVVSTTPVRLQFEIYSRS